jgi:hypothetical protein
LKAHDWRFSGEDSSYGNWECRTCRLTTSFKHEPDAHGRRTVLRTEPPKVRELNEVNRDCDEVLVRLVMRD